MHFLEWTRHVAKIPFADQPKGKANDLYHADT